MRRWTLAVLVSVVIGAALAVAQQQYTARFPSALYTYQEPSDVIRKADFSKLAVEVAALEAFLGVNGRNLPVQSHCAPIEFPASGETIQTVWLAPIDLSIIKLYCEITGGVSAEADLRIDDGSPASVNGFPLACVPSGTATQTLNGDTTMGANDRLDIAIGAIIGNCAGGPNEGASCATDSQCPGGLCTVPQLSLCWFYAKQ